MTNKEIQQVRDMQILKFLEKFKVATTDTIATLFFSSLRMAQRRLTKLVEYGVLKRVRDHFTYQYIYFLEKPKQLQHRLLLTDFYREIIRLGIDVILFDNEYTNLEGIRPDGFIAYRYNNSNYIAFVETERSNKLNVDKYIELYKSGEWFEKYPQAPTFPKLIAITDKKIPSIKEFEILKIREGLSDIKKLIEGEL